MNVCQADKTTPAPCSKTLTLTYNSTASGTLGTPKALTTGQPNLDYKLASGTPCAGSVTQGNTCKVNVTFAPIAPGARNGAVEIVDDAGNILATTYIYGGGSPLVSFSPPTQRNIGRLYGQAIGITIDASGNVFVADLQAPDGAYEGVVDEILASGNYTTVKTIHVSNAQSDYPIGVAVDAAGNLFVGFKQGQSLGEVSPVNGVIPSDPVVQRFGSIIYECPQGIAIDNLGNLYVADYFDVTELQFSTPPPLNFATTITGDTSSDSPQSFQIRDRGNATLDVTSLAVAGPNWFQGAGSGTPEDCASSFTLVPAAECNLSVSFKPTEQGLLRCRHDR